MGSKRSEIRRALATRIAGMTVVSDWQRPGCTAMAHTKAAIVREAESYKHLSFHVEAQDTTFGEGREVLGAYCETRFVVTFYYLARFGFDGLGEWVDIDAANDLAEAVAIHVEDTNDFSTQLSRIRVSQPNENGVIAAQIEFNLQHAFSG